MNEPLVDRDRVAASAQLDEVIDLLSVMGPLPRAEIYRATGWARSTVSKVVGALLDQRQVVETDGPSTGERGRPASLLAVNGESRVALGIDFGYWRVRGVVADAAHRVIATSERALEPAYGPQEGMDAIVDLVSELLENTPVVPEKVSGVGVAVPSPMDFATGRATDTGMFRSWSGLAVGDLLGQRLKVPVFVDNDSRLAGAAEFYWGAGRGFRNMVYFKLHTGVGGAVVVDGSIVRGGRGGAGELGHMSVDPNGPVCLCGSRGCLEVYAGIPAVLAELRPILGDGVTYSDTMRLLREKHPAVTRVFKEAGTRVGQAAASQCNMWNPEAIIIGGALAGAADVLIPEIRDGVERGSLPIGRQVEILPGSLGRMASALGAVRMALVTTHPNRRSAGSARYARARS